MSLTRPNPLLSKWAENGERIDVPNSGADHTNGHADIQTGFPKQTMISVLNGGVPPWGQDHNGILNRLSGDIQWTQAGGCPTFNQDLCNSIGGYPIGTILQTSDTSTPWVVWINLVDGNTNDPNNNAINKIGDQNGWARFPYVSTVDGNSQYFEKDGGLAVSSPTVITNVYVSSSLGSNETGNGTKEKPFKTIIHAINTTQSSGGVSIYLNADDTFYFSPSGTGSVSEDIDGLNNDIKGRYINVYGYNPTSTEIEDAVNVAGNIIGDGTWGYCVSNINRPRIILCWDFKKVGGENKHTYIYGISSGTNSASFTTYGIDFFVDRIDSLNKQTLSIWTDFFWNGINYMCIGCRFFDLPTNPLQSIAGLGASVSTSYSYNYANYFDYSRSTSVFYSAPAQWSINAEDDQEEQTLAGTSYIIMSSNVKAFLGDNRAFGNKVRYVTNPTKSYLNLQTNFPIANVS